MILDLRRLAIITSDLAGWRAMREHQLPPADRARRTDPEPRGCLSARQPAFDSSNNMVPQVTRQGANQPCQYPSPAPIVNQKTLAV